MWAVSQKPELIAFFFYLPDFRYYYSLHESDKILVGQAGYVARIQFWV